MNHNIVSILIVDDDSLDVESFKRTIKKQRFINPILHAWDGVEALEVMKGVGEKKLHRPYIVLMDINMPRMNGIECLTKIRTDPELKDSIIFMMTTSADEQDKYEAYNLNVAGYMVKSDLGTSFIRAVNMLDHYFNAIILPEDS